MTQKRHRKTSKESKIKPIKNHQDIERIRTALNQKPRDLLLFDLVTQTGVGIQNILKLKVKNLLNLKIGDKFQIAELIGKTPDGIVVTDILFSSWQRYLREINPDKDDFIIKSRKGNSPLQLSSASAMIGRWFKSIDLKGLSGSKSLRKTWEVAHNTNILANDKQLYDNNNGHILGQVKVPTIQDTVYTQLFNAVVSGRIPPGKRLIMHQLAKQMHVSLAPVREALRRLEEVGLISAREKQGIVVNKLSNDDLKEITELRLLLETRAIESAAFNCDQNTLDSLEILQIRYIRALESQDVDSILEANKQFHFTAYKAAQMPIQLKIITELWNRISPYFHLLLRLVETYNLEGSVQNHEAILEGLRNQDKKKVRNALKNDLIEAEKKLVTFFKTIT